MSIKLKSMALNTQITATSATARQVVYTSTSAAQIDQLTIKNNHASTAYDVYVYVKSDSTTTGSLASIEKQNIAAGDTAIFTKLISHKLEASYTIQVHDGSGADCYITISGVERAQ